MCRNKKWDSVWIALVLLTLKRKRNPRNERSVPASEHYTAAFSVDLRHERIWEQKRQSRRGCRRLPKNNWTCASFFVCLFVTDTSFPYIRLDCFTYIMQVFTYIMPVKCVPIKAIMRCCSNGVLALRTYARPHATCCYQNPFDVTIWWREFSNEPQISIIT